MKLPEGITFTPTEIRTDYFGNKYLDGIISCTKEFVEKKICEIREGRKVAW